MIAIVYGTKGGMSDVGKFAALHALRRREATPGLVVKVVAVSAESVEGTDKGFVADVYEELKQETKQELEKYDNEILKINIESPDAQDQLANMFDGCTSVVSCIGNRQITLTGQMGSATENPKLAKYLASGTGKIVNAMREKNVDRLVYLSSFGIGDDYTPMSALKVFWKCLLYSILKPSRRDLQEMEHVVDNSGLNYLCVRPFGIDPHEKPKGSYHIMTDRKCKAPNGVTVSKSDVGLFMVEQALNPTLNKAHVTIGKSYDKK